LRHDLQRHDTGERGEAALAWLRGRVNRPTSLRDIHRYRDETGRNPTTSNVLMDIFAP
jgi:hypothetical protein